MNIKMYMSILCLTLIIEIVRANKIRTQRSSPQQYCGSKLANMLKTLCFGKYHNGKRSLTDMENSDYTQLQTDDAMDYPYKSNENLIAFIPSRLTRSSVTKIVDECCRKPCDISELLGYCAPRSL